MRSYLGVTSIIIFILTFLVMQVFVIGKFTGVTGSVVLMVGIASSILLALFSQKGKMKTVLLSLYGVLIAGFLIITIFVGGSGL